MSFVNYDVYVGDEGFDIILFTGIDLTGGTVKISVRKPDLTTALWTASIDPNNNMSIKHTVLTGELNQVGTYLLKAYVQLGSLKKYGKTVQLEVKSLWD